jgi:hypothetical protein
MSKLCFFNLILTVYVPHTCLLCQQHNRPLPSNKGCRLPFNIVEGSLASAEGYGNERGDPGCGRPVRYVRRFHHRLPTTTLVYLHAPHTTLRCLHLADYPRQPHLLPLNLDTAQQQHSKPTTCSKPNVDVATPRMTCAGKPHNNSNGPNIDIKSPWSMCQPKG